MASGRVVKLKWLGTARAAWGDIHRGAILTHTLLQTQDTYTHWYWNPLDTRHSRPN